MSAERITPAEGANLDTLNVVFANGDAALVKAQRLSDGETVTLLCGIGYDGEEYGITPFAEMIDGNPFEMYAPPLGDGGFAVPGGDGG